MQPLIVFLDRATLPERIHLPRPSLPHSWQEHHTTTPEQIVPRLAGATIAIVNKVRLTRHELAQLPDLRLIVVAATGTDNVELDACAELGITVCNVQGYAIHAVAEHTLALMLALSRNLPAYRQALQGGAWQQSPHFCYFGPTIHDLAGKRLGLIGSGSLGQAVARLAEALGMEVYFAGRKGEAAPAGRVAFAQLLQECDVLSLHCPLNDQTRGLIGKDELAMMKPSALLINTARGALVDENALLAALEQGTIAGAASDVSLQEPPATDSPMLRAQQLPNFILTPHVAWASDEAMQRLANQVTENIEAFARGTPLRRVR